MFGGCDGDMSMFVVAGLADDEMVFREDVGIRVDEDVVDHS